MGARVFADGFQILRRIALHTKLVPLLHRWPKAVDAVFAGLASILVCLTLAARTLVAVAARHDDEATRTGVALYSRIDSTGCGTAFYGNATFSTTAIDDTFMAAGRGFD